METVIVWLTLVGLMAIVCRTGDGLVAYDCSAPSMNMTTLSLIDIKKCELPIAEPKIYPVKIQLLQSAKFNHIKVFQCKVEIHRSVFYCGMYSHLAAVNNGFIEYITETSHEKCKLLHDTLTFTTHDRIYTDISPNGTTSRPIALAGKTDSAGACVGAPYSDHYGTWDSVVAYGQIFFTIQDYTAAVNLDKNEVVLRSGVRCAYSTGHCMDIEGGNTYWDLLPEDLCKFHRFSVLFGGKANKIKDDSVEKYGDEIYSLTSDEITFALAVKGYMPVCGYKVIKTEHPRLFILDSKDGEFFAQKTQVQTNNMNMFTYVNAKIVYLERHLKNQIVSMYNSVMMQACELERTVLANTLSIAAVAPAEFAYNIMKGPGYTAYVSGEAVRIAKCIPVEVKFRATTECYQELPVERGNVSLLMLPKTHILVTTGTQVECNKYLSTLYRIDNDWYESVPHLGLVHEPNQVSPQSKRSWKYQSPAKLATSGIYSDSDLERFSNTIMLTVQRQAIVNTVASKVSGQNILNQGISGHNLLDKDIIEKSVQKAWNKLRGFFDKVASIGLTVFGAYMTFMMIKFFIDTVIQGIALHKVYGWSVHLFGAFWNSFANFLIHLSNIKMNENNKISTEEQDPERGEITP